jgi:TetR/AcrR family transcriptional regulator, lmrAB and yxaGH operons repressor
MHMPTPSSSREEVLLRIVATFRQHGYEGSSLALLSEATGLGRSSLYHYFPKGKEDMAKAALEWVLDCFDILVLSPLGETSRPPLDRLKASADGLKEFYADGARSCLVNIFSIGSAGKLFQDKLGECTKTVIRIFSEIAMESGVSAEEAGRRGEDVFIGLQGALIVSRTIGSTAPFLRLLKEFPEQLLRPE